MTSDQIETIANDVGETIARHTTTEAEYRDGLYDVISVLEVAAQAADESITFNEKQEVNES